MVFSQNYYPKINDKKTTRNRLTVSNIFNNFGNPVNQIHFRNAVQVYPDITTLELNFAVLQATKSQQEKGAPFRVYVNNKTVQIIANIIANVQEQGGLKKLKRIAIQGHHIVSAIGMCEFFKAIPNISYVSGSIFNPAAKTYEPVIVDRTKYKELMESYEAHMREKNGTFRMTESAKVKNMLNEELNPIDANPKINNAEAS